jgi:hypothetical protein
MKVVTSWVVGLLLVVGAGVGIESAAGAGVAADNAPGTVVGTLAVSGWVAINPATGFTVAIYQGGVKYVTVLCDASQPNCPNTAPFDSPPPNAFLTVHVDAKGQFRATLAPGRYTLLGSPCGDAVVDVQPGATQSVFLSCAGFSESVGFGGG